MENDIDSRHVGPCTEVDLGRPGGVVANEQLGGIYLVGMSTESELPVGLGDDYTIDFRRGECSSQLWV